MLVYRFDTRVDFRRVMSPARETCLVHLGIVFTHKRVVKRGVVIVLRVQAHLREQLRPSSSVGVGNGIRVACVLMAAIVMEKDLAASASASASRL